MDVTVCVGTYGTREWAELARTRAVPSAEAEGVPVIHYHHQGGQKLAAARNRCFLDVETEWVIHLDADDELEPGYVKAMAEAEGDVRAPMVRFVYSDRRPKLWRPHVAGHEHACDAGCLPEGNWVVIGAAVRTELVGRVGGWEDWPVYEDWSLWLRIYRAGGTFGWAQNAIYRAHVRSDSRNRGPSHELKERTHREIAAAAP